MDESTIECTCEEAEFLCEFCQNEMMKRMRWEYERYCVAGEDGKLIDLRDVYLRRKN